MSIVKVIFLWSRYSHLNPTMRSSHKFYPGGVKFQIWSVFDAYKDICVVTCQDCICLFCPHTDLVKNESVI